MLQMMCNTPVMFSGLWRPSKRDTRSSWENNWISGKGGILSLRYIIHWGWDNHWGRRMQATQPWCTARWLGICYAPDLLTIVFICYRLSPQQWFKWNSYMSGYILVVQVLLSTAALKRDTSNVYIMLWIQMDNISGMRQSSKEKSRSQMLYGKIAR